MGAFPKAVDRFREGALIKLGARFIRKLIFVSLTLLFGYLIWKYY